MLLAYGIALLAPASPVGIHVKESEEVDARSALTIARTMGDSITRETGLDCTVDDTVWSQCSDTPSCVADVAARTGAIDVVLLRLYGARTKVLVVAERFTPRAEAPLRVEESMPRDEEKWRGALEAIARKLFAGSKPVTPPLGDVAPEDPVSSARSTAYREDGGGPWVWLSFGAGLTALGVGIALGVSSRDARSTLREGAHTDQEIDALSGRAKHHALAANVLFSAAAIAVVSGAILWWAED